MNLKSMYRKHFLFCLGAVFCVLLLVGYPKAETETSETEDTEVKIKYLKIDKNFIDTDPVDKTAEVMEVNAMESYIVIAEERYYVAEFKVDGQVRRTALKDMAGNKIGMNAFAKRDLVKVTAIELNPKGHKYVALTIRMLPPR